MRRIIATMLLCGAVAVRIAAAEPSELERLRAENARLKARIAELEGQNTKLEQRAATPMVAALEQSAKANVEVAFDRDTGVTTTSTAPSQLEDADGTRKRQWMTLRADRPGEHPTAPPDRVQLVIETRATAGGYKSVRSLHLSLDGTPLDLPVADYRSEPITTSGRTLAKVGERETVIVPVPLDALARIAKATAVQVVLGPATFQLTAAQLAEIRAFHERITT